MITCARPKILKARTLRTRGTMQMAIELRSRWYINPRKNAWRVITLALRDDPEWSRSDTEEGVYEINQRGGKLGAKGREHCRAVSLNFGAAEGQYRAACADTRDDGYQPTRKGIVLAANAVASPASAKPNEARPARPTKPRSPVVKRSR